MKELVLTLTLLATPALAQQSSQQTMQQALDSMTATGVRIISGLAAEVAEKETEIVQLQGQKKAADDQVVALNARIADLQKQLDAKNSAPARAAPSAAPTPPPP